LPANVAIAVHPRQRYVVRAFRKKPADALAAATQEAPKAEIFVIAEALLPAFLEAAGFEEAGYSLRGNETDQVAALGDILLTGLTGEQLAGSEAQHPFLPRTARIITAEFVTMDTGTGQVHIAPGHGADDYTAGVQNGLPILSPVDENGRFTEEVGVPVWAGKYLRCQQRSRRAPARKRDAPGRTDLSAFLSALLALQNPHRLPRGRTVFHPHRGAACHGP
jgi:isoleucyl-tRNA synthetase